jgi:hypothetical protein
MRIIKAAPAGDGTRAHDLDNRPAMHGSKAEFRLMSGTGSLINWGLSGDIHVGVTGERPKGTPAQSRRPGGTTRP